MEKQTQQPKLSISDCHIDWKYYPITDEHGNHTTEDRSQQRKELFESIPVCDINNLANTDLCFRFCELYFDMQKLEIWMNQEKITKSHVASLVMTKMFNCNKIKSPTHVDWREMIRQLLVKDIDVVIKGIDDPNMRVEILKHLVDNVEYIFGSFNKRAYLPGLKNLLNIYKAEAKVYNEELKQKAAAEKNNNKTPKEKPEYILTLDEIINYVREENPDSAHVIRGMLRFFAMEKSGWSTAAVKKRIEQINQQTLVQQTNINAPISNFAQEQHIDHLTTK